MFTALPTPFLTPTQCKHIIQLSTLAGLSAVVAVQEVSFKSYNPVYQNVYLKVTLALLLHYVSYSLVIWKLLLT